MPPQPRRRDRARAFLGDQIPSVRSCSRSTSPAPLPPPSPHPLPPVRVQVVQPSPSQRPPPARYKEIAPPQKKNLANFMNQSSLSPTLPSPPASISIASLPPILTTTSSSSPPRTPAPPPYVQWLPVVLATTHLQPQPQPQLPSGQAETPAFVEALKKHVDALSPEEQLKFKAGNTTITPEGLIAQTRKYDEIHNRASRSRQCASRVEGFLKSVDSY